MTQDEQHKPPTPEQIEAFRIVAQWAWSNRIVPSEIHDAAAFALDQPSFAHGFYTPPNQTFNYSPSAKGSQP